MNESDGKNKLVFTFRIFLEFYTWVELVTVAAEFEVRSLQRYECSVSWNRSGTELYQL